MVLTHSQYKAILAQSPFQSTPVRIFALKQKLSTRICHLLEHFVAMACPRAWMHWSYDARIGLKWATRTPWRRLWVKVKRDIRRLSKAVDCHSACRLWRRSLAGKRSAAKAGMADSDVELVWLLLCMVQLSLAWIWVEPVSS